MSLFKNDLNEQRTKVFLDRYALKDEKGEPIELAPQEMWWRVSDAIGDTDEQRSKFRDLLYDFKFVPGGRILSGAGTETEVTYYNCYVIPIETKVRRENAEALRWYEDYGEGENLHSEYEAKIRPDTGSDSREAILDTISVMVDIMSRGGGVGINWSVLRPKGTHLKRVNGTTSGPVSWMDVASHAVQTVTQGGTRRGAAMFMLDDWHPDLMEFIDAKRNLDRITGANVSVSVSDAFMEAVASDSDWDFIFPDTESADYNGLWDGDIGKWRDAGLPVRVHSTRPAREIWQKIAESAWHNGEPGIVFLDRYNQQSTGLGVERIICVNPCGEQGLGPYSVCNLGSMNLAAYLKDVSPLRNRLSSDYQHSYEFDWTKFTADAETEPSSLTT